MALTRFIDTSQCSIICTLNPPLTKQNFFLVLCFGVVLVVLIYITTRFLSMFVDIEDNVLVANTLLPNDQKIVMAPAKKRQLIATLQSIRMHNVTRYQHFFRSSLQWKQHPGSQSQSPHSDLPSINLPQSRYLKIAQLDKSIKTSDRWNSVDDSHGKDSEPFEAPIANFYPVKLGW